MSPVNAEALALWNRVSLLGDKVNVFSLLDMQLSKGEAALLLEKFVMFRNYEIWLDKWRMKQDEAKHRQRTGKRRG